MAASDLKTDTDAGVANWPTSSVLFPNWSGLQPLFGAPEILIRDCRSGSAACRRALAFSSTGSLPLATRPKSRLASLRARSGVQGAREDRW